MQHVTLVTTGLYSFEETVNYKVSNRNTPPTPLHLILWRAKLGPDKILYNMKSESRTLIPEVETSKVDKNVHKEDIKRMKEKNGGGDLHPKISSVKYWRLL